MALVSRVWGFSFHRLTQISKTLWVSWVALSAQRATYGPQERPDLAAGVWVIQLLGLMAQRMELCHPAPEAPPPGSTCAGVTHLDLSESRLGQLLGENDQKCPATCHVQNPAFVVLEMIDKIALVSTGSDQAWVPRN